jgi:hypothetical protein
VAKDKNNAEGIELFEEIRNDKAAENSKLSRPLLRYKLWHSEGSVPQFIFGN